MTSIINHIKFDFYKISAYNIEWSKMNKEITEMNNNFKNNNKLLRQENEQLTDRLNEQFNKPEKIIISEIICKCDNSNYEDTKINLKKNKLWVFIN